MTIKPEDQLLSPAEVKNIINELMATVSENSLTYMEAERYDSAIVTLSSIHEWMVAGKPKVLPSLPDV